jgi:hypothetical protein
MFGRTWPYVLSSAQRGNCRHNLFHLEAVHCTRLVEQMGGVPEVLKGNRFRSFCAVPCSAPLAIAQHAPRPFLDGWMRVG